MITALRPEHLGLPVTYVMTPAVSDTFVVLSRLCFQAYRWLLQCFKACLRPSFQQIRFLYMYNHDMPE